MALVLYQCYMLNTRHAETLAGTPDPEEACKVFDGTCSSIQKQNANVSARLHYVASDAASDGHDQAAVNSSALLHRSGATRMLLPDAGHRRTLLALLESRDAGQSIPSGWYAS